MSGLPESIKTWQMVEPGGKDRETGESRPGKLELKEIPVPELGPDEVLIEETFHEAHERPPEKRIVLTPDF